MKRTGTLDAVQLLEKREGIDVMRLTVDFEEVICFGDYKELFDLIGEELEFDTYESVYDGENVNVVLYNNFVNNVNKVSSYRYDGTYLIQLNQQRSEGLNFSLNQVSEVSKHNGVRVIIKDFTQSHSDRAIWTDVICVFKNNKTAAVKIFHEDVQKANEVKAILSEAIGSYAEIEGLYKNKYGLQASSISLSNVELSNKTEVDIAKKFIIDYFKDDPEVVAFLKANRLLSSLEQTTTVFRGYELVNIAAELMVLKTAQAIVNIEYKPVIEKLILATRLWAVADVEHLSHEYASIIRISSSTEFTNSSKVNLLSVLSNKDSMEYTLFEKIQRFAADIVETQFGDKEGVL